MSWLIPKPEELLSAQREAYRHRSVKVRDAFARAFRRENIPGVPYTFKLKECNYAGCSPLEAHPVPIKMAAEDLRAHFRESGWGDVVVRAYKPWWSAYWRIRVEYGTGRL